MLKGITNNGEMKNVRVDENGAIMVNAGSGTTGGTGTSQPTAEQEVVLNSSIQTIGTTATTISIGKKVTNIMVANYSEEADITITAGEKNLQVGASLALELPINTNITNLSIVSTAEDTKVQLVVKGVE